MVVMFIEYMAPTGLFPAKLVGDFTSAEDVLMRFLIMSSSTRDKPLTAAAVVAVVSSSRVAVPA
jgi:hypothetical protein